MCIDFTERNCSLPGGEKVSFGDTYELPCTLAYQKSVTYSATCVYQNGDMTFIGENIEACPGNALSSSSFVLLD